MPTSIKALILDIDGVLWRAGRPIGDLPAAFERIRAAGLRYMIATNNSTRTVPHLLDLLHERGIPAEARQVVTSSVVTAEYLSRRYPSGAPLYAVGEAGLHTALTEHGFRLLGEEAEETPAAVVVGMDRRMTYAHLRRAALWIRAGAEFIGTNPDRTYPTPEGLAPGAGSLLAAVEAATDKAPLIMGKPAPEMFRQCLERLGTAEEETLMVGDRLETDIRGAQALGLRTALVLSGVTTRAQAEAALPAPDWIAEDLSAVLERITDGK